MSLALAAELNGYPGPSHTLELAAPLGLSNEQKHKTQALFAQMQADAKRLGEQLIASEQTLDRLFKEGKATVEAVQAATANAARTQGELRAAHLGYHLSMREVLTATQVARYNELRGYRGARPGPDAAAMNRPR
jgi:Spy/CpxP family protein refolding chaperone